MKEIENIRAALAAGPTPGPWNKTVLDTDMHDKSDSTYVRGMKLDECVFVGAAVTSPTKHVVLAPFDYNDSPEGMCSPNAAYIAACNPAAMTDVLAHIDAQAAEIERLKTDAARYQELRRGQKWSVIDGIGDTLRAESLDAAIDAAKEQQP